jgi:hypothetical protein
MASRTEQRALRHIVDVDGLLLGIDEELLPASALLARAGVRGERRLVRLLGERVVELERDQPIAFREDEVAFFRSIPARVAAWQASPTA